MLEFDDRIRRFLAHILDRILVSEPIGPLDGVVHMPAPVVLTHIAERGTNAALRGHRVATRRKYLRDTGGPEPLFGESEGRPQTRPAGADDDNVVGMVDEFVSSAHAQAPKLIRNTANIPTTAA